MLSAVGLAEDVGANLGFVCSIGTGCVFLAAGAGCANGKQPHRYGPAKARSTTGDELCQEKDLFGLIARVVDDGHARVGEAQARAARES